MVLRPSFFAAASPFRSEVQRIALSRENLREKPTSRSTRREFIINESIDWSRTMDNRFRNCANSVRKRSARGIHRETRALDTRFIADPSVRTHHQPRLEFLKRELL